MTPLDKINLYTANRMGFSEARLTSAPIGTKAPAIGGGHWIKNERGWKWCTGATFPFPGGDWTGELIEPESSDDR